jgi:hypothetical protein
MTPWASSTGGQQMTPSGASTGSDDTFTGTSGTNTGTSGTTTGTTQTTTDTIRINETTTGGTTTTTPALPLLPLALALELKIQPSRVLEDSGNFIRQSSKRLPYV